MVQYIYISIFLRKIRDETNSREEKKKRKTQLRIIIVSRVALFVAAAADVVFHSERCDVVNDNKGWREREECGANGCAICAS